MKSTWTSIAVGILLASAQGLVGLLIGEPLSWNQLLFHCGVLVVAVWIYQRWTADRTMKS